MDMVKANDVAAILTSIAAYGGQLAAVFHNYALIAERIPSGFEGATNILDATLAILKQVLGLVKDEAGGKKLFNQESLTYVEHLAQECALTLAKVEPTIADACLERKERKAKRKQSKKIATKNLVAVFDEPDLLALKLDEKDFLDKVEKARWSLATDDIETCMERLYDLQLHFLLVFEVVQVGALSKDLSSGKVDIKSIVNYHDRINRTADLVGIKAPKGRSTNRRRTPFISSGSDSSSTGSDSDASSFVPKKKKKFSGPPPLPLPRPNGYGESGVPSGPSLPPAMVTLPPPPPPRVEQPAVIIIRESSASYGKPPAYSETRPGANTLPAPTMPQSNSTTLPQPAPVEKATQPVYPDEKSALKAKDEPAKTEEITKSVAPEGRLFKSPSNGMGFKLKSFFRSKDSLAAEMRRTLSDSESHLMAYVVQRHDLRQVPHSAFHTLEATHMKTILSQLNGSEWYKTFSLLDTYEHASIARLLHPVMNGIAYERELVVLKVLEQNRFNAWMALLGELLRNRPFPYLANGRVLLAIVREKFVNGKPVQDTYPKLIFPGGPPPPPPPPAPFMPSTRPPPAPYNPPKRTTISDLKGPPPPPSNWPILPQARGPPGPPPLPRGPPPFINNHNTGPGGRSSSTRTSDITPITDSEAFTALTTYNEYTLRLAGKPDDAIPRTWSRATITQENSDRPLLLNRIASFNRNGGNIIEVKLRLTELQSSQVTRMMDDLKCSERDSRFEWTWVEMSLYNDTGEITTLLSHGCVTGTTTRMHLIAKRTLKASYKALDVYNALMKPAPPPRPPVTKPPVVIDLTATHAAAMPRDKKSKYVSSSSESESDTSCYSSDSSVGHVRRQLRCYRAKKMRKSGKGRRCFDSSDSDSDSEDDDVIEVKVVLKRGDDVVKVLLEKWTPEVEGKGKGKGVA